MSIDSDVSDRLDSSVDSTLDSGAWQTCRTWNLLTGPTRAPAGDTAWPPVTTSITVAVLGATVNMLVETTGALTNPVRWSSPRRPNHPDSPRLPRELSCSF